MGKVLRVQAVHRALPQPVGDAASLPAAAAPHQVLPAALAPLWVTSGSVNTLFLRKDFKSLGLIRALQIAWLRSYISAMSSLDTVPWSV